VTEGHRIKVAMGQMLVEGGRLQENLARAVAMVGQAGHQGCQIVVLPECLDLGWTHLTAGQSASEIPGSTSEVLCRAAAEAGVYLAAGLTERAGGRSQQCRLDQRRTLDGAEVHRSPASGA